MRTEDSILSALGETKERAKAERRRLEDDYENYNLGLLMKLRTEIKVLEWILEVSEWISFQDIAKTVKKA